VLGHQQLRALLLATSDGEQCSRVFRMLKAREADKHLILHPFVVKFGAAAQHS